MFVRVPSKSKIKVSIELLYIADFFTLLRVEPQSNKKTPVLNAVNLIKFLLENIIITMVESFYLNPSHKHKEIISGF